VLAVGFLLLVVTGAVLTDPVTPERARLAASSTAGQHAFRAFTTDAAFAAGTNEGTQASGGALRIATTKGTWTTAGRKWAWTRWTSPWVRPAHPFTQLIPSWNVVTPANTAVLVQARIHTPTGRYGAFKTVGLWATRDNQLHRTSSGPQSGPLVRVDTDTLKAASGISFDAYQLRILPLRVPGTTATPIVNSVNAVASRPATAKQPTSHRLLGARELVVPRYSQMTHRGQYPRYGGGGEAWCSPTSLSMILGYYKRLPTKANYAWVSKSYADPWVDHVARVVYDYGYSGTGNWPFNTAYAANLTGSAFVTRLASLRGAERFIHAGIPLAASISFGSGGLDGAPISSTAGHLVVITGFTAAGNVVVNDPAAPTNASVRRVYDRGQFERAWQTKSAGTVYVVRDAAHPLPARAGSTSW
jgi:Peptidase_C39 like family